MTTTNLHPDDLLFFNEVRGAMVRVAKQYELPLRSITALAMPSVGMSDRLGDCTACGNIRLVMRCTVNGAFVEHPMSPGEVWDTAAHELAHLKHMNHGTSHKEFTFELLQALKNQQVDHREKVLARLVKMQAQRDGEAKIGNTAAAEAFATAINRMLIENELQPTDIDYARTKDNDPVIEKKVNFGAYKIEQLRKRSAWQETLARIVAKAHLCTFLLRQGSNDIWFVGTEAHATVAEYTFGILVPAAQRLMNSEYQRYRRELLQTEGSAYRAAGFREAWITGFLIRIRERFDEARTAAVQESVTSMGATMEEVPGLETMALMRLSGAMTKVNKYIDNKFASRRRGGRKTITGLSMPMGHHSEGRARGTAAANAMAIGRRAVTSGVNNGKLIG